MTETLTPPAISPAADSPLALLFDIVATTAHLTTGEERDVAETAAADHIYTAYPDTPRPGGRPRRLDRLPRPARPRRPAQRRGTPGRRAVAPPHHHRRRRPPPEQRAETERLARQAEERAAEERRLDYERWMWGGWLPSEGLRGVGGNVRGLLRFDSDLVHALDTAGSEAQRAVALLAAQRACEAADLMDLPWITQAHTALAEKRPLPPPFDDPDQMWETLSSDPQVPSRSVLQAVPPERPPYRPLAPQAATERTRLPAAEPGDNGRRRQSLGRVLGALIPSVLAGDSPTPTGVWGTVRGPQQIAQPYFALPAVLSAAEPDPLKAALDGVWHAVNTYGEHYPELLEELRSVCADQVEE